MNETIVVDPKVLALVPIIAAVLQAVKILPVAQKFLSWLPLISLAAGVGLVGAYTPDLPIGEIILTGLVLGASASGLYSATKTLGTMAKGSTK